MHAHLTSSLIDCILSILMMAVEHRATIKSAGEQACSGSLALPEIRHAESDGDSDSHVYVANGMMRVEEQFFPQQSTGQSSDAAGRDSNEQSAWSRRLLNDHVRQIGRQSDRLGKL